MNTSTHDFVTVDMRGLKAALVARARARQVSVSELVRGAVARDLGAADHVESAGKIERSERPTLVKLSIRLSAAEAARLADGATAAGMSRGAFLTGLLAGVPVLTRGGGRADHMASLTASNAELSTLSRNIHHLTTLLRESSYRAAQEYCEMLQTLEADIRGYLTLASSVLAELRPREAATPPSNQSHSSRT